MPERGYLAATESDITHAVAGRVFGKQQQGGANPLPHLPYIDLLL